MLLIYNFCQSVQAKYKNQYQFGDICRNGTLFAHARSCGIMLHQIVKVVITSFLWSKRLELHYPPFSVQLDLYSGFFVCLRLFIHV